MDCDPPGFSVPGISHGRQLEWVAISFSRGYSWPRYQTHISCSGRQILYNWDTSISSVQLISCVQLSVTPWTATCQASLSVSNSWSLLKLMSIELVMPFNHLILWHPLLLLASIFPSIRVFSNESVLCIRCPNYWSFSFSIRFFQWIFRTDFLQAELVVSPYCPRDSEESFPTPQSKSINSLVLSFLYSPALHLYMTTGKTVALNRLIFVGKVMSLLFNMLSRLVLTSFIIKRSKRLLISWLQSLCVVILEPPQIKSVTVSTFSPSICHEVMGLDAIILVFWMLSFKPMFSLFSFTFVKRLFFRSSLLSDIRVVSSAYLKLLIYLLAILIPACASSSPAFLMMYSAYNLNKQGDNIQPWHTPFPIWNQYVVPCPVLTCFLTCIQISQKAGQVVWYSHLLKNFPQFIVIHTVKGFGIVKKAEINAFLELSHFFWWSRGCWQFDVWFLCLF